MIGIIGAMEEEVSGLKEKMKTEKTLKRASMEFCQGTLDNKEVVVVRCGIGKVNAAICTQILVDEFKVNAIINTGIAGSLKNEINIGDIVLSSDTLQHDMDATGFGYEYGVGINSSLTEKKRIGLWSILKVIVRRWKGLLSHRQHT